jgi:hypothetical protein
MNAFLRKLTGQQHSDDDWRRTASCSATWLALKADYLIDDDLNEKNDDEASLGNLAL